MILADGLLELANQQRQLELAAEDYRGLLRQLEAQYPGLGEAARRYAVAIDGLIYQEPLLETLAPNSEVAFLPRLEGG